MSFAAKTSEFGPPPSGDGSIRQSEIDPLSSELSTINSQPSTGFCVSLLTGGGDKPYALGMAAALTGAGISLDFIGSDDLAVPEVINNPDVTFLNLRGDPDPEASLMVKVVRVLKYYGNLIRYAAGSNSRP